MKNLKFIEVENFECDHVQNQNIFLLFDECINILNNLKLNFLVTGSLGLILNKKKFYRTIKDIDFVIERHLICSEIGEFKKYGYNFMHKNYNTDLLLKNNIKIEFHSVLTSYKNSIKNCITTDYNESTINLVNMDEIFLLKRQQSKQNLRFKDLKDLEFFRFQ